MPTTFFGRSLDELRTIAACLVVFLPFSLFVLYSYYQWAENRVPNRRAREELKIQFRILASIPLVGVIWLVIDHNSIALVISVLLIYLAFRVFKTQMTVIPPRHGEYFYGPQTIYVVFFYVAAALMAGLIGFSPFFTSR